MAISIEMSQRATWPKASARFWRSRFLWTPSTRSWWPSRGCGKHPKKCKPSWAPAWADPLSHCAHRGGTGSLSTFAT